MVTNIRTFLIVVGYIEQYSKVLVVIILVKNVCKKTFFIACVFLMI